jgi:hypothetical protein
MSTEHELQCLLLPSVPWRLVGVHVLQRYLSLLLMPTANTRCFMQEHPAMDDVVTIVTAAPACRFLHTRAASTSPNHTAAWQQRENCLWFADLAHL